MSETINQIVNDLESGRPVLTYDELMTLRPTDYRWHNLTPGHNEPGQRTWGRHVAGSDKPMSEELYYASIWVLYNGGRRPPGSGRQQLVAMKRFFARQFRPGWTAEQLERFANASYT